jgi:hypothetical protein
MPFINISDIAIPKKVKIINDWIGYKTTQRIQGETLLKGYNES